jgi:hypothetical protein
MKRLSGLTIALLSGAQASEVFSSSWGHISREGHLNTAQRFAEDSKCDYFVYGYVSGCMCVDVCV